MRTCFTGAGCIYFHLCCTGVRTARSLFGKTWTLHRATARMAKLVDAWDLKSPARKGVPVRFRLRAPYISRVCERKLSKPLFVSGPQLLTCSAIHLVRETFSPFRLQMYCSVIHDRMPRLIPDLQNVEKFDLWSACRTES